MLHILLMPLTKGPWLSLITTLASFRSSNRPPSPPPPSRTMNYSWVAGLVEVNKGKGLGHQLWWGHLGLAVKS